MNKGEKENINMAILLIKSLANKMTDEQLVDVLTTVEVEMKTRRVTNTPENP